MYLVTLLLSSADQFTARDSAKLYVQIVAHFFGSKTGKTPFLPNKSDAVISGCSIQTVACLCGTYVFVFSVVWQRYFSSIHFTKPKLMAVKFQNTQQMVNQLIRTYCLNNS